MKRPTGAWVIAFGVLLAPALLLGMGVAVVGATDRCPDVVPGVATYDAGGASSATGLRPTGAQEGTLGLTTTQWSRASAVVATGQTMRVPVQGIVIALAVARQESGFQNYANDGRGGDLAPDQVDVARSLRLPHDAVGTDHGSVGLFQQQWPWWGSLAELMTPATAARKFYQALLEVPGWQFMPLTVAAQRVQRSAYPDAYADDADLARSILQQVAGTTPDSQASTNLADCADPAGPATNGNVSWPVPARLASTDRRNWGGGGAHWSSWHTGTDFSVPCGTPVLAAHAGTVHIDRSQPWAGPQLLKIAMAPGRLTTWYAHMQTLSVRDGDAVRAGQPLGEVGEEGNSTGCHLHFEVHTRGGPIYGEDNTNPTAWLKQNVGRRVAGGSAASSGVMSVTQYNVKNRPAAVTEALRSRPTLLGLNESDRLARTWLTTGRTPGGYTLVAADSGSPGRRQNSLLVGPGVRVVSTDVVPLSNRIPGDTFGHDRWALVTVLDVPGVGRHTHIQTHFNAGVRNLSATAPRAREYAASVRNLDRLLDRFDGSSHLTLAADMNLGRRSDRPFAWAPMLARHGLEVHATGVDAVASRGLGQGRVGAIPRGLSDHPAIEINFRAN